MKSFWDDLPRPFFVLAPLANVTDAAFRRVIAKYGKPDATWTEFVSADGLALAGEEGRAKLMRDLVFTDAERPIVAQFFSATPEYIEKAAALAQELGFDGVDINMGCPDKAVEKQGAGAKLILNPERAQALISAAKRGAPNLPVSIKTRLGYNKDILEEPASPKTSSRGGWLATLLEAEPAAITIHARTRREMSKVAAHWDRVKRAVEIRDSLGSKTFILGNGDAKDLDDARQKAKESGADGVMLGRAIFGNPWLFAAEGQAGLSGQKSSGRSAQPDYLSVQSRLSVLLEHTKLFEELLGDIKSFAIMKKHFKAYVEGFAGAKDLRIQLMEAQSAAQVAEIVEEFSRTFQTVKKAPPKRRK